MQLLDESMSRVVIVRGIDPPGTCHLERIQVLGEPIEKVRKKFRTSFL
jgi:hypothetical protein